MSYVWLPPQRALGDNVLTQAASAVRSTAETAGRNYVSDVGDYAKHEATDATSQLLESNPTCAEVAREVGKWKGYADAAGSLAQHPTLENAAAWTKRGLIAYAQAQGYNIQGKDIKQDIENVALGYGEEYLREQGIPISPHYKDFNAAATNICAAGACYALQHFTGFNPQLAMVTIDAIKDGHITSEEAHSIGTLAGAIAGGAICQCFGVPAPIGAFIGGIVGGAIADIMSDWFGIGSALEYLERTWQHQRIVEAAEWQRSGQEGCSRMRATYWRCWDEVLSAIEIQWQRLECAAGARFDLRWFGNAPSDQFIRDPKTTLAVTAGTKQVDRWYCTGPNNLSGSCAMGKGSVTLWGCPKQYGCPYPRNVAYVGPTPVPMPRAQSALQSLGMIYPGCADRKTCIIAPWDRKDKDAGLDRYKASVKIAQDTGFNPGTELTYAGPKGTVTGPLRFKALDQARVQITGDLIRTAAAVQTELTITARNQQLAKTGLDTSELELIKQYAIASERSRKRTHLVNYGMLAAGLGALALAAASQRRR